MVLHPRIVPACNRGYQHSVDPPLDMDLIPLLSDQLDRCFNHLNEIFFKRTLNNKRASGIPFHSTSADFTSTSASVDSLFQLLFNYWITHSLSLNWVICMLKRGARLKKLVRSYLPKCPSTAGLAVMYSADIENLWSKLSKSVQFMFKLYHQINLLTSWSYWKRARWMIFLQMFVMFRDQ